MVEVKTYGKQIMGQDVDVWTLDFMIQIFRQKKTKKE
jgi:hypothetical protein